MNKQNRYRRRRTLGLVWLWLWLCILGLVALAWWCQTVTLGFNLTPSMPLGWYRRVTVATLQRGDIVAVCLPKPIAAVGLQQHYLAAGCCPSGSDPVLKVLIAIPGDKVSVTPHALIVNGRHYLAPQFIDDQRGHRITRFIQDGTMKRVTNYWLYGRGDPQFSWDSRYYGGVPRAAIIGVYQPVLTF